MAAHELFRQFRYHSLVVLIAVRPMQGLQLGALRAQLGDFLSKGIDFLAQAALFHQLSMTLEGAAIHA